MERTVGGRETKTDTDIVIVGTERVHGTALRYLVDSFRIIFRLKEIKFFEGWGLMRLLPVSWLALVLNFNLEPYSRLLPVSNSYVLYEKKNSLVPL